MSHSAGVIALALSTAAMSMLNPASARAANPDPLLPRALFFGNPERAGLDISPDGSKISYLAPVNGVLNVWVGPRDNPDAAKPVTEDKLRGITNYFWAYTSDHILYVQDKGGDENWHVYSTNLKTGKTIDLTPFDGVQARVNQRSTDEPTKLLVSVNNRNPQLHDLYKVDIVAGDRELLYENNDGFVGFLTEDDMKIHGAVKMTPDGGQEVYTRTGDDWNLFATVPGDDALTTSPVGLDESGENIYMIDSRGRNTAALTMVNLKTKEKKTLATDPKADIAGAMGHPTKRIVQAVNSNHLRRKWQVLDKSIEGDLKFLETVADGEFNVTGRTLDDNLWTVAYVMDNGPVRYYLYDRGKKQAKFLFTNRPDMADAKLAKMHPVAIPSRDGLELVSYYSLPRWLDTDEDGVPSEPIPMVLFVHGGPWARDSWGYHPYHQWLANRGYAVLSVNYRGSTGFGKEFINKGNMEWAGKMHDDLIDAVDWAIKKGIAKKDEVAIMGGSYGGYATLVGLTFTPDKFACGVDIVGPSNIKTLIDSIPPYWKPIMSMFTTRVGDPATTEGAKLLEERSPLNYVDRIKKPLLIGQGANDPRVKQAESDQIVEAMQRKNIPVTYVLFPDEGHGFRRPENNMAFNAVTETFLAQNLGGRLEPMSEDITGSSILIPAGKNDVKGLPKTIPTTPPAASDGT